MDLLRECFLLSLATVGYGVAADGIVDGQLQPSIVKMQRCTLNGCGKVCYLMICKLCSVQGS